MSRVKAFLGLRYFNIPRSVSPGNWPRGRREAQCCAENRKRKILARGFPPSRIPIYVLSRFVMRQGGSRAGENMARQICGLLEHN